MKPLVYQCLLGLLMTAGLHAAGDDRLIAPGEKIGQVMLGTDVADVERLLGQPTSATGDAKKGTKVWMSNAVPPEETAVVYGQDGEAGKGTVRQISVSSAFFHTSGGNTTNSDLTALWREFPGMHYVRYGDQGDTSHVQLYDATAEGVAIMVQYKEHPAAGESWGRCRAIIVHRRGERPSFVNLEHALLATP